MKNILLRTIVGISFLALILGTPPAYAIFGIRAARTVIAARKAGKMVSSPPADKAVPQVKGQTGQQAVTDVQN